MPIYSKPFGLLLSNANGHVKGEMLTEPVLRCPQIKMGSPWLDASDCPPHKKMNGENVRKLFGK